MLFPDSDIELCFQSTPTSTRAAQENARIQQAGVLYHAVQNLLEFRAMNRDGFRKTLKKHDKVTQVSLTSTLMPEVDSRLPVDQDHRLQAVLHSELSNMPGLITLHQAKVVAHEVLYVMHL